MAKAQVIPISKAAAKYRTQAIVACTDLKIEQLLVSELRDFGIQPLVSHTLDEIKNLLTEEETVLVFSQTKLGDDSLQAVLRAAESPGARVPVIVCSENYDEDLYINVMSMGAFDYLVYPYTREEVAWVVKNAFHWGPLLWGPQARRGDSSLLQGANGNEELRPEGEPGESGRSSYRPSEGPTGFPMETLPAPEPQEMPGAR